MKNRLLLVIFGTLLVAGCNELPAYDSESLSKNEKTVPVKKKEMRPETLSYLLNNNHTVCIGNVLYFAAWEQGGVVIRSPVMDSAPPYSATLCKGGIPLNRFGKLR